MAVWNSGSGSGANISCVRRKGSDRVLPIEPFYYKSMKIISNSLKEQTKNYYNIIAERYISLYGDKVSLSENACVAKFLTNHLDIGRDALVLDLGCGGGLGLELLNNIDGYVGIDIAPKMIELAKAQHKKGVFLEGDMENLEFEEGSFDYVISIFGSFSHSACPEKVVEEIMRVLKPGGKILIMTYSRFALANLVKNLFSFGKGALNRKRCYVVRNQAELEPRPIRAFFYTAGELDGLFSRYFKNNEVHGLNIGFELPFLKPLFRRIGLTSRMMVLEVSVFGKIFSNLAHSLILIGEKK